MPRQEMLFVFLAAVVAVSAAAPAGAQLAVLEHDLNDLAGGGLGSVPSDFRVVGERLLFTAEAPGSGREMWATDGTPGGTELLADACPGECPFSGLRSLAAGGGLLYYSARTSPGFTGFFDTQLWRTDGTREGTFPLFGPVAEVSYFSPFGPSPGDQLAFAGERLLFRASTPEHGVELWASDGTVAGTGLVADLTPGPVSSDLVYLTPFGGEVYFLTRGAAGSPRNRPALWASDGTATGTRRVAEIAGHFPDLLTAAGERLFFTTADPARLWVSDGTTAGTGPVPGVPPRSPFFLWAWGNQVVYAAEDEAHGAELWASDGTGPGTRRLTGFALAEPFGGPVPQGLATIGDRIYFFAREAGTGQEPWITDGTPEGSRLLVDLCPGPCSSIEHESRLVAAREAAFFTARGEDGRLQLWRSDGTPDGTFQVSRRCDGCSGVSQARVLDGTVYYVAAAGDGGRELWRVGPSGRGPRRLTRFASADPFPFDDGFSPPPWLARLGDRLLFAADDGVHGRELWIHPGGAGQAASLVADLSPDAPASGPAEITAFGDGVAFSAFSGRNFGVWTTRAGAGGTLPATPADPFHPCGEFPPAGLTAAPSQLFLFCGFDLFTQDLYRTDGTPEGTFRLTDLAGFAHIYLEAEIKAVVGDELFFAVNIGDTPEVWRSDGTPGGTGRAFGFSDLDDWFGTLQEEDGALYVVTGASTNAGNRLYGSDGTDAGTVLLAELGQDRVWSGSPFLPLGGTVLFSLVGLTDPGGELWATDGTPEGTAPLVPFPALRPKGLTRLGDRLYFVAAAGAETALWETDGTAEGTLPVRTLGPTADAVFFEPELTRVGQRLFFVAYSRADGRELWTSDGTAAGTVLARDIVPGPGSSFPHGLTAAGDELFFAATDGSHGVELWSSDEHAGEVRLVHDLNTGPASAAPRALAAASPPGGDRLFFSADDGLFGRELWGLPLHPRLPGCVAGETAACVAGTHRAEVAWRDGRGRMRQARAGLLTRDTAAFSFFVLAKPELAAKVLDGTAVNGHCWVFFGALTDLGYALTVTDAESGLSRRYLNPPGRFAAAGDVTAFGPRGASLAGSPPPRETPAAPPVAVTTGRTVDGAGGSCTASATRLCLQDGRFAVEVAWRDFAGRTGAGRAAPLAGDRAGSFWFFRRDNVELLVEVIDGRAVNGRFWVFYGALSNVEYTLTVTDTATGEVRTYLNPAGTFAGAADTGAF